MLVLSRRIGEEIVIGADIVVKVTAVNGPRVRLGITAPVSIPVARMELFVERSASGVQPKVAVVPQTQRQRLEP